MAKVTIILTDMDEADHINARTEFNPPIFPGEGELTPAQELAVMFVGALNGNVTHINEEPTHAIN